jgi:signal transduction histidine kinase
MTVAPDNPRSESRPAQRRTSATPWDVFDRDVVAPLYAAIDPDAPVRAWVTGACEVEIAWGVALGLLCGAARTAHRGPVRVIATDPDRSAVQLARGTTPSPAFLRKVPSAWREEAARLLGDLAAIPAWVRRHVMFSTHQLGLDPPFAQLDLIVVCDGAGLDPTAAQRLALQFAFALREGGTLCLLGAPLLLEAADFESFGTSGRVFRRVRRHMTRLEVDGLISDVVAAERFRMGEHLHDGIGQHLTALSLALHRLRNADVAVVPQLLARLEEMLLVARNDLRAVARGELALELPATSLSDALETAVADARRLLVADVELEIGLDLAPLEATAVTQLVRIAQEALRNAAASGAKRIAITVRRRGSTGLELAIRDDAGGMDRHNPYRSLGLGLRIMRHRADLIGATLRFASDEHGTTIICALRG